MKLRTLILLAELPLSVPAHAEPSIPYVVSHSDAVQDMLWMTNVGEDDIVYDLGSGDGRIAIAAVRDFGARRAVGVEIDPKLVSKSRDSARAAVGQFHVEAVAIVVAMGDQAAAVVAFVATLDWDIFRCRLARLFRGADEFLRPTGGQRAVGGMPGKLLLDDPPHHGDHQQQDNTGAGALCFALRRTAHKPLKPLYSR